MKELITLAKTLNILAGKEIAVIQNGILAVENGNIKITCQHKDIYHVTILENGKVKKGIATAETKHLHLAIAQYCNFDIKAHASQFDVIKEFCELNGSHKTNIGKVFYFPYALKDTKSCICVLPDGEPAKFSELVLFKYLSKVCDDYGVALPTFSDNADSIYSSIVISQERNDALIMRKRHTNLFALCSECNHKQTLVLNLKQVLSIFEASYQNEFK